MTKGSELLDRLDAAMDSLAAALSSHNRLSVVRELAPHVSAAGDVLDAMCAEARLELDATVCLVTFLDDERQEFIGSAGPFPPDVLIAGTDVGDSLCQYVVATGTGLQVDDTDSFCAVTPGIAGMVGDDPMHSYCGEPIRVRDQAIGSFCALNAEVRHWGDADRAVIRRWSRRTGEHLAGLLA